MQLYHSSRLQAIALSTMRPSEEFDLTANSLLKLMEGSFGGHLVSSQRTHKMSSHCELAVGFL